MKIQGFDNKSEFRRYWSNELEKFKQQYRDRKGYKRNALNFFDSPEFREYQRRRNISLTALNKKQRRIIFEDFLKNFNINKIPNGYLLQDLTNTALLVRNYPSHIDEIEDFFRYPETYIFISLDLAGQKKQIDLYFSDFSATNRLADIEALNIQILDYNESYLFSSSKYVTNGSEYILFIDIFEIQK